MTVSTDGQHIDLLAWAGDVMQWKPLVSGLRLRSDDWWWSDAQPTMQFRWQLVGNGRYLLTQSPAGHYRVTIPLGQQMPVAPAPLPPNGPRDSTAPGCCQTKHPNRPCGPQARSSR